MGLSPRPHPCPRDLPGRSLLSCPTRSSGCSGGSAAPAPEPAPSSAAANVRTRSSAQRPPRPPGPTPAPTPDRATSATPGAPGRRRGCLRALRGWERPRGCGDLPLGRRPQGRPPPPAPPGPQPARPAAPSAPGPRAPTYPPRRGRARAGCGVTSGCGAPLRPRGRRSPGVSFSRGQTPGGASRSSRSGPPRRPAPSFSLVSRLFFPG